MSSDPTQTTGSSDLLFDAIDYAFVVRDRGDDGLVWLDDWRHCDQEAVNELADWRIEQVRQSLLRAAERGNREGSQNV